MKLDVHWPVAAIYAVVFVSFAVLTALGKLDPQILLAAGLGLVSPGMWKATSAQSQTGTILPPPPEQR